MFDALVLDEQFFNSDKQRHYNIVQFTLTNDTISPICTIDHGVWTHPQMYIQIKAHTPDEALTCFIEHQIEICNALYDNDIAKIQGAYEKILNVELQRRIKEKFGILLTVTKDYNVAREGDDFLWLAYRTAVNDRFIMIYRSDSTILTRESLINNRNRICRQYIEGEKDNIHPIVTQLASLPYVQPIQLGKKVGMEMRGLWETENDYMGGPFYHFSYVNDYGKCISVDGFVYAPNESKRDYIRQVEAIVKSVK